MFSRCFLIDLVTFIAVPGDWMFSRCFLIVCYIFCHSWRLDVFTLFSDLIGYFFFCHSWRLDFFIVFWLSLLLKIKFLHALTVSNTTWRALIERNTLFDLSKAINLNFMKGKAARSYWDFSLGRFQLKFHFASFVPKLIDNMNTLIP